MDEYIENVFHSDKIHKCPYCIGLWILMYHFTTEVRINTMLYTKPVCNMPSFTMN